MEALQADASRLLEEYDSSNSAGNRLQRRLLTCDHTFQQLDNRSVSLHDEEILAALLPLLGSSSCHFGRRGFLSLKSSVVRKN